MPSEETYINERLDHLGIIAGVCQEIGLAACLDAQDPTNRQQVSVGTATVAMILNGLGFSNRQLYLVPQFFANKPVEHLLGPGITAEMLNDDCLGRTLDRKRRSSPSPMATHAITATISSSGCWLWRRPMMAKSPSFCNHWMATVATR